MVIIRPHLLDEVLVILSEGERVDAACLKDLLAGRGVQETFKEHRAKK